VTCALVAQAPCLPLGAFPPTLTSGHVGRVFHSTTLRDGLFFAGIIASKERVPARQMEVAAHINEWLSSPGLRPAK
jgi:hypothetical protein